MTNTELAPNEVYRGYTIVNMVENPDEFRIMFNDNEYIHVSDGVDTEVATFIHVDHAKSYIDSAIRSTELRDLAIPRERVELGESGMNYIVNTPGGDIKAMSLGDTEYPSLDIEVQGRMVAYVEWHPDSKQFNLYVYDEEDELIFSLENIRKVKTD